MTAKQVIWKVGSKNCLSVQAHGSNASAQSLPSQFSGRANSIICPRGMEPGSAWVLMLQSDLDTLEKNSLHDLTIKYGDATTTFKNYIFVRSLAQTKGLPSDRKKAALVEFRDIRHVLKMSFSGAQYNVRQPAPTASIGAGLYYAQTLSGGTTIWTWATMLADIWGDLPTGKGTAPTLPYTPDGTPEDWRLENAWEGLGVLLGKLSCDLVLDPTTGTFSIVETGSTQSGLSSSQESASGFRVFDFDMSESDVARIPQTVTVLFRQKWLYAGTEADTPNDGNWMEGPHYVVNVATNVSGATAGTKKILYDDLPATVTSSTGSVSNTSALSTRANEVAGKWLARAKSGSARQDVWYGGVYTSMLPGAEIGANKWRDYGNGEGLITETYTSPDMQQHTGNSGGNLSGQQLTLTDIGRHSHPVYPRESQLVQVYDSGESAGDVLEANASGYHEGRVVRYTGSGMTVDEDCWILIVDDFANAAGDLPLNNHEYYLARLAGCVDVSSDFRPLYLVRSVLPECPGVITFTGSVTVGAGASVPAIALTAASLPSWASVSAGVVTLTGDAVGKYVRIRAHVNVDTASTPTTDNRCVVSISDSGLSYCITKFFLPLATGNASHTMVTPTIGPIFSGWTFKVTAAGATGSDTLTASAVNSSNHVELELLPCVDGFNLQVGTEPP